MNLWCHTYLSLLFCTSYFCLVVYGAIISNHSSSLVPEFSNLTEDGLVGTLFDFSGLGMAPNISLSSPMIEKIFLWTRSLDSGHLYELLDLENTTSITASHFLPNSPTFIIVHGFLGDGLEPWILGVKNKLLTQEACNVVSIQWPSGHEYIPIDYWHVVGHVPVVGAEIATLLDMLAELRQQNNSAVHIIGHSLGAHIAGFVGKNVGDPIGRISGLDPAGFDYHNSDSSQRLDRSDATYVDVIHTNGCRSYISFTDCFGIDIPLGHTDYWPNGGRHQPACHGKSRDLDLLRRAEVEEAGRRSRVSWSVGCDHMMSHTYFLESLDYDKTSNLFRARPCESYHQYNQDNCSCGHVHQCMGFNSDHRGVGDYYLNTSSSAPYAQIDPLCAGLFWNRLADVFRNFHFYAPLIVLGVLSVYFMLRCCTGRTCRRRKKRRNRLGSPRAHHPPVNRKCICGRPDCTAREDARPLDGTVVL